MIMIFAFIIYHLYIIFSNLHIGTSFVEGMRSQKKISNFFPSKKVNRRGKPMDSNSGALSGIKIIPRDAGSNIKLDYEFKIRGQGLGNNIRGQGLSRRKGQRTTTTTITTISPSSPPSTRTTTTTGEVTTNMSNRSRGAYSGPYGQLYLINKTTNKTKLIKSGSGRGTQIHKGSVDISDHVKAGDKVQLKFKTSRWSSGNRLFWFYWKNLHLKYTQKRQINRMKRGALSGKTIPRRFLVRYYRVANRQTSWWWNKMKLRRNQSASIKLILRTRKIIFPKNKPLNRNAFLFLKSFDRNNNNSLSWYEFRDWMAGVQFSRNRRRMRQRNMKQRNMRRNMRQKNMK